MQSKSYKLIAILILLMLFFLFVSGCTPDMTEEITKEINRELSDEYEKVKVELGKSAKNKYEEIKEGIKEGFSGAVDNVKDWFGSIFKGREKPEPVVIADPAPDPAESPETDVGNIHKQGHPLLSEEEFNNWDVLDSMWSYRFPDNLLSGKGYNCTWYAYGRMLQLGCSKEALDTMRGFANQWAITAAKGAYRVDPNVEYIEVPSIAYWDAGVGGADANYGHVAVIEGINSDGSIIVSESAWGKAYNIRTIHPNNAEWPSGFIVVP